MGIRQASSPYMDLVEAVMELHEEDVICTCQYCHQMETLSFVGARLASSLNFWKQLPDGTVVHSCEMSPTY